MFSPEKYDRYANKVTNRKLKIQDSFTKIYPTYTHEPRTCYTKAASHIMHPKHETSKSMNYYNHKMDPMKEYAESMFAMKALAPEPRRAVKKYM